MKILVTGREGQLAQSLAAAATARDDVELVLLGRPDLDLERAETIGAIADHRPDLIVNAAAYTAVDQAEDEPERAMRINGHAPGEIARLARRIGARMVQVSTDYVFDGSNHDPYAPGDATAPLGAYGRSKLAGETAVRAADPDAVIVRTAWVYSPFGKNFLKTMLALARTRDELTVVGDQFGNPSSAQDLAQGLLAIADTMRRDPAAGRGGTFHLAGSGSTSWAGFAREIMAASAARGGPSASVRDLATADWPTRAARPQSSMLDSRAFADTFGFVMPDWKVATDRVVASCLATTGAA